ncbi:MAG TPA: hypothetical protein PK447_08500 [Ignavibacteria bacterium]|nr:hypothetical protein [Ignavibacteria bacterium]
METGLWIITIIVGIIILIATLLTSVTSLHKRFIEKYWKEKK